MDEQDLLEERRDNRPRSNTWPLPEPPALPPEPTKSAELPEIQTSTTCLAKTLLNDGPKKSSRKNAWGNLSYADLITQAIQSASEKRLTLAEIYEWMVQTIPYFKDKGDSNSSAGWKNSIRHNLSLHSKFIRVQNEGNGKSSWWMLNPDAKAGKTVRRQRSGSLDSAPKAEGRKRGRSKKEKIKEIGERPVSPIVGKNGSRCRASSPGNVSPTNTSVDALLPDSLPLHLSDSFERPRTSSNASTHSSNPGRLSPIHDQDEFEDQLQDGESMSPCGANMATSSSTPNPTDELIKTLEERMSFEQFVESPGMKQSLSPVPMISRGDISPIREIHSPSTPMSQGYDTGYDSSGVNGYLNGHQPSQQNHSIFAPMPVSASTFKNVSPQQVSFQNRNGYAAQDIQQQHAVETQQNLLRYNREAMDQEMETVQPIYGNLGPTYNPNMGLHHNTMNQSTSFSETCYGGNPSIIINNNPTIQTQSPSAQHQQHRGNPIPELTIAGGRYPFPNDLDGFYDGISIAEEFDCDVERIIQSEMGDGGFDCLNFDQLVAAQSANTPVSVGEMRLY